MAVDDSSRREGEQYIEILASGQRYALEMSRVFQLLRWQGAVAIPKSKAAVRGAVNVRGQIVPVIDLRRALLLEETDYGRRGVLILLQDGQRTLGLLVEAVAAVFELEGEQRRLPPAGIVGEDEPVAALLHVRDDTVFLLDVVKLAEAWLPPAARGNAVA